LSEGAGKLPLTASYGKPEASSNVLILNPSIQSKTGYFFKIAVKNSFISFQESLSAIGLYSMGILNFFPVFVDSGFVKA